MCSFVFFTEFCAFPAVGVATMVVQNLAMYYGWIHCVAHLLARRKVVWATLLRGPTEQNLPSIGISSMAIFSFHVTNVLARTVHPRFANNLALEGCEAPKSNADLMPECMDPKLGMVSSSCVYPFHKVVKVWRTSVMSSERAHRWKLGIF